MNMLRGVEGPLRGKAYEVTELASIGRADSCAVQVQGRNVSKIHARIEKRAGGMFLRDNGSRNGVFVNGRKVSEALLKDGDEIEIGEHVLVFNPTPETDRRARSSAAVVESLSDPFAPGPADERLPKFPGAAAALAAMNDGAAIARALLDALMSAIGPERGVVMTADESGRLQTAVLRAPSGEKEFALSNVLRHALEKERRGVIATDVLHEGPRAGKPVCLLAVPLGGKGTFVGLACLESKLPAAGAKPPFSAADLRFAMSLAAFAGTRIAQLRDVWARPRPGTRPLPAIVAAFEKECLAESLRLSKGDLAAAAKLLKIAPGVLDAKLKAHRLLMPKG